MTSHVDASYVQGNILIARDGEACLGDFGIASAFRDLTYHDYKLETIRYMAPERLSEAPMIDGPSKVSDVYSLAMTSFKVRSSVWTIPLFDTIALSNQVLTGILPYGDSNIAGLIDDIRSGQRPLRPTNPSRNQWLQDPVWDAIVTCWKNEPALRYELSVVHDVFSNAKLDKQEQRGKLIPRIASLFQFLRLSEPEIERLVDQMDKVGSSTFLLSSRPMANARCSASRITLSRIGNG